MKSNIKTILKSITDDPGVYFFKNKNGIILYIGKAKNLHDRISSYFIKQPHDWKIAGLLSEFETIETIKTKNEIEALLLEAKLIGSHKPKYNTLLKEGNPFVYILKTNDEIPDLEIVRNKKKGGIYFGPLLHKKDARNAITFLKNSFTLNRCNKKIENGCLDFHIGRCAGTCKKDFDSEGYKVRMELAIDVLKDDKKAFIDTIKAHIKSYSSQLAYEKARTLQKYLENLDVLFKTLKTKFNPEKYITNLTEILSSKQYEYTQAAGDTPYVLQSFLKTKHPIHTIDCFDISHFQSHEIVGSCIRFNNGTPDKSKFRKFLIQSLKEQNDYAALQEIVSRRYKQQEDIPDLILIDGGKGQLSAVKSLFPHAHIISLAKREERIFGSWDPEGIKINAHDIAGKILLSIRDYAHHFAISYHRLRRKNNFI